MHNVQVGKKLPDRMHLRVTLQDTDFSNPHIQIIGENQSVDIPLYEKIDHKTSLRFPCKPCWYQDKQDIPQLDLNEIGIRVPYWHDAVKISLPNNLNVSDMQVIEDRHWFLEGLSVGDRVLIVGFPYGYSPIGMKQPTSIVLTRYIAATQIEGRHKEILLDGMGAPGMSGDPVFVETTNGIFLAGIYTGMIYPDHVIYKKK